MSDFAQEKSNNMYSPTGGPPSYPAGAGQPFVPGGPPPPMMAAPPPQSFTPQPGIPQPGFAPSPYGAGIPQPQFQQQQQPVYASQPQVVVASPPIMMGGRVNNLSQYAAPCLCPSCGQTQVTRINYESGSHTHLWAIILGVLFCCCCIPYMVDGLKDVRHSCGNCGIPLAIWHRSGGLEVLAHQQPAGMPLQPQVTGVVQPQFTGAVQPQYTGVQSPPAQYVQQGLQPQFTGPGAK